MRWSCRFSFSHYEKGFSFMFLTQFFKLKTMVVSVFFFSLRKGFSFIIYTSFFELKTTVVSVFFFSLRKKLQLYVFYSIFRAEDDGRVSFLFLVGWLVFAGPKATSVSAASSVTFFSRAWTWEAEPLTIPYPKPKIRAGGMAKIKIF